MDWARLLRRTGLDQTPMDNQCVTCTQFAEPNQVSKCIYLRHVYASVCGCDLPLRIIKNSTQATILSGSLSNL